MKPKLDPTLAAKLLDAERAIRDKAVPTINVDDAEAFARDVHSSLSPTGGAVLGTLLGTLIQEHGAETTRRHVEFLIAAIERTIVAPVPDSEVA